MVDTTADYDSDFSNVETDKSIELEAKIIQNNKSNSSTSERVIVNIGGTRFETFVSTLTKYPYSLLGIMFHERNSHLRKPDKNGEYFFDRNPVAFDAILNFYRTGKLCCPPQLSRSLLEAEVDYWQIPVSDVITEINDDNNSTVGKKCAKIAMQAVRLKAEPVLESIKEYIIKRIQESAAEGLQSFSIEFKESASLSLAMSRPSSPSAIAPIHNNNNHHTSNLAASTSPRQSINLDDPSVMFYSFLSNFSNRELLLHDLLAQNLDVQFNDMTSVMGHSYILSITLWDRYTAVHPKERASTSANINKLLDEIRKGVEVKTSKDAHILTVKPIFN